MCEMIGNIQVIVHHGDIEIDFTGALLCVCLCMYVRAISIRDTYPHTIDEASSLLSDSDGHRLAQFVHKSR